MVENIVWVDITCAVDKFVPCLAPLGDPHRVGLTGTSETGWAGRSSDLWGTLSQSVTVSQLSQSVTASQFSQPVTVTVGLMRDHHGGLVRPWHHRCTGFFRAQKLGLGSCVDQGISYTLSHTSKETKISQTHNYEFVSQHFLVASIWQKKQNSIVGHVIRRRVLASVCF